MGFGDVEAEDFAEQREQLGGAVVLDLRFERVAAGTANSDWPNGAG